MRIQAAGSSHGTVESFEVQRARSRDRHTRSQKLAECFARLAQVLIAADQRASGIRHILLGAVHIERCTFTKSQSGLCQYEPFECRAQPNTIEFSDALG